MTGQISALTMSGSRTRFAAACLTAAIVTMMLAAASPPASWLWPVDGPPSIERPFDLAQPFGAGHRGIDIPARPGAAVHAPAPGTVRFAGWVVDRPVLTLAHPGGAVTSYEPVTTALQIGDAVSAGQQIGALSTTARHTPGGALHLGLRVDGEYQNPAARFPAVRPRAAVLLPLTD